ncbi:hypothetical protein EOM39_07820, partial [Candidatus Gracilibacteria bacterium]|nr:hypothetical protein [Candidatus Gracilibacteria bacterium]
FFMTERYGFVSTLYKPFRTLEDSIEGLEFAKENNESGLYESIFYDMEKFGYINVLKKYVDETFQAYLLSKIIYVNTYYQEEKKFFLNNLNVLDYLEKKGLNMTIIETSTLTKSEYEKYKNGKISEKEIYNNINIFWNRLYNINGIHQGMFGNSNKLYKYKKVENGDWELIENNKN